MSSIARDGRLTGGGFATVRRDDVPRLAVLLPGATHLVWGPSPVEPVPDMVTVWAGDEVSFCGRSGRATAAALARALGLFARDDTPDGITCWTR